VPDDHVGELEGDVGGPVQEGDLAERPACQQRRCRKMTQIARKSATVAAKYPTSISTNDRRYYPRERGTRRAG
jgi:hypothetical protein